MISLYANPYGFDLEGFYFKDIQDYEARLAKAQLSDPSGDFEHAIELIDGPPLAESVFSALTASDGLSPTDLSEFFDIVDDLENDGDAVALVARAKDLSSTGSASDLRDGIEEARSGLIGQYTLEEFAREIVQESGFEGIEGDYFDYDSYGRDYLLNWSGDDETEYDFLAAMSDQERGEYVVYEIFGELEMLGKKTLEQYFDYEYYARDLRARYSEYTLSDGTTYLFADS